MTTAGLLMGLTACSGPFTVRPDLWCRPSGMDLRPAPEVTVRERVSGVLRDCAPMVRVRLDSYAGPP